MHRLRPICLLSCLVLWTACAEGGAEDRPESEVKIAANHHLLWFRSLPGFGPVASRPDAVFSGHGVLSLADDSTYRVELPPPNGISAPDRYALANDGELAIFNTGSGRDPSTVFRGGYRLVGDQPDLFFTDRVSAGNSASIGLYFGTRTTPGQVELEGGWHVLSMHVMLAPGPLPIARNVARAAHGGVSISAGAPGTPRTISGTGSESGSDPSQVNVTFGGSIQNLLDGTSTGDGSCNLTVDYNNQGSPVDSRVCRAAAGRDIVMAVDEDESDGEAGVVFLVRKFNPPAAPVDPTRIGGTFLIGGYTAFVNPTNAGSDVFVGVLTLTTQGGFRLDGVGHQGIDFTYAGTFTVAADGGLTFTVNGTNETWFAAMNRSYDSLVLVDAIVENRTNNTPELNLVLGVRERPPQ